jgi:hypothetical protein
MPEKLGDRARAIIAGKVFANTYPSRQPGEVRLQVRIRLDRIVQQPE